MIKIAICDDENMFITKTISLILNASVAYDFKYQILTFHTGQELLSAPFDYDILFLDIMLDNDIDGISLGKTLREKGNTAMFILSTSLDTRYQDGYLVGVHRYLTKPLNPTHFNEALISAIKQIHTSPKKISLRFKTTDTILNISDILYIESHNRKRLVYTTQEEVFTLESLDSLQEKLLHSHYYRLQQSFLINLAHVTRSNKTEVIIHNKHAIPIPKKGYESFNLALMQFLGGETNC